MNTYSNLRPHKRWVLGFASIVTLVGWPVTSAFAQEEDASIEEVVVTGSRIRQDPLEAKSPVVTVSAEDIKATGLNNVGDVVNRLTVSGGALNTRFNSSGNFGFPPDGSGIGAGSSQVDLRNLGPKRVLVLVDGIRWVSESSASGVSTVTDLNTIPVSIIERVEVLTDSASAVYGSDAIAGVVNIITKKDFEGFEVSGYVGGWDEGDGDTTEFNISLGTGSDQTRVFLSAGYTEQESVRAADRDQARESAGPGTTNRHGSSGTPQGRFVFEDPRFPSPAGDPLVINCTTNFTVQDPFSVFPGNYTGDFSNNPPFYSPTSPCGFSGWAQNGVDNMGNPIWEAQFDNVGSDDFHPWSNGDRFNFAPFNLVVTPSERWSVFGQAIHTLTENVDVYLKGLYNNRKSTNQAAPEPLFIGSDAGNGNILDTITIDATQIWNPFGITIDATQQSYFMGRRPLEGGPRVFNQDVDTWYLGGGLQGQFNTADRDFFWDVNAVWSQNKANQTKMGGYNARKLKQALGPDAECVDGCVPFNFFGGQGPNGSGTITPEMLAWVAFTQQDASEQELVDITANISGTIVELPAGPLGFAAGYEHREQDGRFQPDATVVAGDSAGIPALPTSGGIDVDEFYGEISIPLLSGVPGADLLDVSLAARRTDYDLFDDTTARIGARWRPTQDLLIRGTFGEGFRAPSIGELFGSATRFDATIADPCSDFNNTGVSQAVIDNCVNIEGVPADGSYVQLGGQISVLTGGNTALKPETSDSLTLGAVYNPDWVENVDWIEALTVEVNYYEIEVDDAIQAVDAETVLDACANLGDPVFCDRTSRTQSGVINRFDNQLTNVGGVSTDGWDINIIYASPAYGIGQFLVAWTNTIVSSFEEELLAPTAPGGFITRNLDGVEENDRGIPEWQSNLDVSWALGDWTAGWTLRFIDELTESCSDFLDGSPDSLANLGLCSDPDFMDNSQSRNKLDSTVFNDFRGSYAPSQLDGNLVITLGVNNAFAEDPPDCYSCSLNGYDPSTYDVPGRFWYLSATYRRQ